MAVIVAMSFVGAAAFVRTADDAVEAAQLLLIYVVLLAVVGGSVIAIGVAMVLSFTHDAVLFSVRRGRCTTVWRTSAHR